MAHIRRRSTGDGIRYDVRWRLPTGRVANKAFRRRADADAFRRSVEADELAGLVTDRRGSNTTVSEVAETWMASDATKRASSLARDRSNLRIWVLPAIGDRPVRSITRADVQGLVNRWTAVRSASTVGRIYGTLRAVLAYAEDDELIARNPCRRVRLPKAHLVDRPQLGPDRLAEQLDASQALMMWTAATLGLRWAECAGLTVANLDPERATLSVRQQLTRDGKLAPPKSAAGRRTMTVPDWLMAELVALAKQRRADGGDALVFVSEEGHPHHYSNWRQRIWLPATTRAGLAGLRFHDLRSIAATNLVVAGVDVKTAQARLGHASPQMTLGLYARATRDADQAAAALLGERMRPRDSRAIGRTPATSDDPPSTKDRPDQDFQRGRYGTRTHDLSRVKAAL